MPTVMKGTCVAVRFVAVSVTVIGVPTATVVADTLNAPVYPVFKAAETDGTTLRIPTAVRPITAVPRHVHLPARGVARVNNNDRIIRVPPRSTPQS
jgi:hypothetical protein